jgi:hypothetical protein
VNREGDREQAVQADAIQEEALSGAIIFKKNRNKDHK